MFQLSAFSDEAGKTLKEQIAALKRNSLCLTELRTVDGVNIADITEKQAKEYASVLKNEGISLSAIGKEIFGLDDVNELPIAYNIAWYEQKAVIVLLALLYLGVKNIHLGPTLPAFLSPNVAKVLVDNFGIAGIGSVDEDMELFLGK